MKRGSIHLCDFGEPVGHEPAFIRPAIVISHERINKSTVIVIPVTKKKRGYPTHVELDGVLPMTSYAQCEFICVVSTSRIIKPLGHIDPVHLAAIGTILRRILVL